jgi:hypothetical protein
VCAVALHRGSQYALSVALRIRYGGQPLEISVPGAGFDRRQAVRAWEVAVRLREQGRTFRCRVRYSQCVSRIEARTGSARSGNPDDS